MSVETINTYFDIYTQEHQFKSMIHMQISPTNSSTTGVSSIGKTLVHFNYKKSLKLSHTPTKLLKVINEIIEKVNRGEFDLSDMLAANMLYCITNLCTKMSALEEFGNSVGLFYEILEIISKFEDSEIVARKGLTAIRSLCRYGPDNSSENIPNIHQFGALGACEIVMRLLELHGYKNSAIAEYGLQAMTHLAENGNKSVLSLLGACEIIIQLLQIHSKMKEVVESGIEALEVVLNIKVSEEKRKSLLSKHHDF